MIKICRICGKEFEPIKHGAHRECCYECIPQGVNASERASFRRQAFKKKGLEILGSKCMKCGDMRSYVLDFHHKEPELKTDTLSHILTESNYDAFFNEVSKCILLCANCHREFHFLEHKNGLLLPEFVNLNLEYKSSFDIIEKQLTKICPDCGEPVATYGARCKNCANKNRQTIDRPEKNDLAQMIASSSFCEVGRRYGVADNTIRKWCTAYDLPTHKKEIQDWVKNNLET